MKTISEIRSKPTTEVLERPSDLYFFNFEHIFKEPAKK